MTPATAHPRLTSRQHQFLDIIACRIQGGLPPTVRELGNDTNIRSPNGVICHLKALERKGLIRRNPHVSRSIFMTDAGLAITNPPKPTAYQGPSKAQRPNSTLLQMFSVTELENVAAELGIKLRSNAGKARIIDELCSSTRLSTRVDLIVAD